MILLVNYCQIIYKILLSFYNDILVKTYYVNDYNIMYLIFRKATSQYESYSNYYYFI